MPTCFISHTWRKGQHRFALRLRDALVRKGIEAWVDEEQILPGDLIKEEMRKGILYQSDVFLFVLSPEALRSENCLLELNWAVECRRDAGLQIVPILRKDYAIPKLLQDIPLLRKLLRKDYQIPEPLQGILYIDFRNDRDFDTSVEKLLPAIEYASGVKLFCRRLLDDDRGERIESAQALADLKDRFTVPVITRRRTADYDPEVRYWLAIALGEVGGEEAVLALREAMAEPDPRANQGVTDALTRLGKEALWVVLNAAHSPDPIVRRGAAQVLVDTREQDARIQAALARLKNDPDKRVRGIAQRG